MKPLNHIIFSVDEDKAYTAKLGEQEIYLAAQYGGVADNAVQEGEVYFAPEESGLKKGDIIYFHHLLIDEIDLNTVKIKHRNYDLKEVPNTAYVCEKGSDEERTGWKHWIFAYKRGGVVTPYADYVMCKATKPVVERKHETMLWEGIEVPIISKKKDVMKYEPNIVEVVKGPYKKGTRLIKKKDGDYPLVIDGELYEFLHPRHIIGTEDKPSKGWNYILDLYQSTGSTEVNGLVIPTSQATKKHFGKVILTTNDELKDGDEVIFAKSKFQKLDLPGVESCFAVRDEEVMAVIRK